VTRGKVANPHVVTSPWYVLWPTITSVESPTRLALM